MRSDFWFAFLALAAAVPLAGQSRLTCSSDDMHRHYCAADTGGGVRLLRQRSEAACREGYSWGADRRGIWVDHGCRADFELGGGPQGRGYGGPGFGAPGSTGSAANLTCSSDDMRRHYCATDTSGGVRLLRQRSEAACREGYSWGADRRGIWVDHGCRADFEVGGGFRGRGYGGPGFEAPGYPGSVTNLTCSSDDMRRHYCAADTRGGVRLLRQRSDAACQEGYSWGADRRGIWVDHGCRADFQVGGGGAGGWQPRGREREERGDSSYGPAAVVTCSSDDMHRHFCSADTRGGVRLLRQRSEAACREGYSWGADRRGIWVDHGCRADFSVGR